MTDVFDTIVAPAVPTDKWRTVRVLLDGGVLRSTIPADGAYLLGRGVDVHVHVNHPTVSRRHAELRFAGASIQLTDLGSANGSRVRGVPLAAGEPVALELGQVFSIGDVLGIVFDGQSDAQATRSVGRAELAPAIERAIAFRHEEGPFSVCTLSWPNAAHHLDAIAAFVPAWSHVAALNENLVGLVLPRVPRVEAAQWLDAITAHFTRSGGEVVTRLTGCPEDGDTLALLCPQLLFADATAMAASRGAPGGAAPGGAIAPPALGTAMQKVHDLVEQVAATPTSILILGETGVGKEVMATNVHRRSNRAGGPFVALNCAALPETLLESELFGYERGAFTGAQSAKQGLIEAASGGTLFLDELGEMPLSTQAKLLRVLEERTVLRLGSVKPKPVDIRLVAATNRELLGEIEAKRFRADLYYRLNSIILRLPPLRERKEEIGALASLFAENAAGALGRPVPKLPPDVMTILLSYPWPGNVRELRNAVERMVLLARQGVVSHDHLPDEVRSHFGLGSFKPALPVVVNKEPAPSIAETTRQSAESLTVPPPPHESRSLDDEIARIERGRIVDALDKCAGNQTRAAEMLGITRRVLIGKMEKYGLPRPRK